MYLTYKYLDSLQSSLRTVQNKANKSFKKLRPNVGSSKITGSESKRSTSARVGQKRQSASSKRSREYLNFNNASTDSLFHK